MSAILALYRGESIARAKLVAATADEAIVADFTRRLLEQPLSDDPVLRAVELGRRRALRLITADAETGDE